MSRKATTTALARSGPTLTEPTPQEMREGQEITRERVRAESPVVVTRDENGALTVAIKGTGGPDLMGSGSAAFIWEGIKPLVEIASAIGQRDQSTEARIHAACAAMKGFKPADEIEAMIAAQAVALHFAGMETLRRSVQPNQPADIATRQRKDAANLFRAFTDMLDALDAKRGKRRRQVVRVERVVVNEGGQAVVGNVER